MVVFSFQILPSICVVVHDCELERPNFKSQKVPFRFPAPWLLYTQSVIDELLIKHKISVIRGKMLPVKNVHS